MAYTVCNAYGGYQAPAYPECSGAPRVPLPSRKVPENRYTDDSPGWMNLFEMSGVYDESGKQKEADAAPGATPTGQGIGYPYNYQIPEMQQVSSLPESEDSNSQYMAFAASQNATGHQFSGQATSEAVDIPGATEKEQEFVITPESLKKIEAILDADARRQLGLQNDACTGEPCVEDPNCPQPQIMRSEAIDVPHAAENEEKIVITPETLKQIEEILEADLQQQLGMQNNTCAEEPPHFDSGFNWRQQSQCLASSSYSRDQGVGSLHFGDKVRPDIVDNVWQMEKGSATELNPGSLEQLMGIYETTGNDRPIAPCRGCSTCPMQDGSNFAGGEVSQAIDVPNSSRPRRPDYLDLPSISGLTIGGSFPYGDKSWDMSSSTLESQIAVQSQPNPGVLREVNRVPSEEQTYGRTIPCTGFSTQEGNETFGGTRRRRARRPIADDMMSPEEQERIRWKREKNKEAAARCRKRKMDMIESLSKQVDGLEGHKRKMLQEVTELLKQKEELEFVLEAHRATCINRNTSTYQ